MKQDKGKGYDGAVAHFVSKNDQEGLCWRSHLIRNHVKCSLITKCEWVESKHRGRELYDRNRLQEPVTLECSNNEQGRSTWK